MSSPFPLTMTVNPASVSHQGETDTAVPGQASGGASEPMECPICYQEYNQYNKCPRMLECLHVFCTECLQRLQLCPCDQHGLPAIPCPLCRHLTPLASGDPLSLPCNSRILAGLPRLAFSLPVSMTDRLSSVTQRVVFSLDAGGDGSGIGGDTSFIILPTVSLRVQRMHPGGVSHGAAPGLVSDAEAMQRQKGTLLLVQLLALTFWVMFIITCVLGVVFGPNIFK